MSSSSNGRAIDKRSFVKGGGLAALTALTTPLFAQRLIDLGLPGAPGEREITTAFPQKGPMILQRSRPPLLETPMEVFDGPGVLTPNDRFFVRWHWSDFPTSIDVEKFRLSVRGAVKAPLSLSLEQLLRDFPRVELEAVNQCSGNSRGLFQPPVPGGQWGHGAMGNARWLGVRLKDVLDRAGVTTNASSVRFGGLDQPLTPNADDYSKSLSLDHARDGDVMIAFGMNGEAMPLLNGFPLRLVVPGWFSTYWIKMLSDIEVLDKPDDNFWMAKAYKVPDNRFADVKPGTKDFASVPISTMVPRAWITNLTDGAKVPAGSPTVIRGIAMGGTSGVSKVELSIDNGRSWRPTKLGPDESRYGFRRFEIAATLPRGVAVPLLVRCTNQSRETQPLEQIWNPSGYRRAGVETMRIHAV